MKNLKLVIFILSVLCVMILVLIVFMKYINKNQINEENNNIFVNNKINQDINVVNDIEILEYQDELKSYIEENPGMAVDGVIPSKVVYQSIYDTVQNCIKKYLQYVFEPNINAVYGILDNEWIEKNGITNENIVEYVKIYNNSEQSQIMEVYEVAGIEFSVYQVKYQLGDNIIFFTLNMDSSTDCFSIFPITEDEYNKKILESIVGTKYEKTIEANQYNKIEYATNIEV